MKALLLLLILAGNDQRELNGCNSKEEYSNLMNSITEAKGWREIAFVHRKFESGCDDGAFAEAYSEKIESLFSKQFEKYFKTKIYEDSSANAFILRHIDEAWSSDVFSNVKKKVVMKCSNNREKYCQELMSAFGVNSK